MSSRGNRVQTEGGGRRNKTRKRKKTKLTKWEIWAWWLYDVGNSTFYQVGSGFIFPIIILLMGSQYTCPYPYEGLHSEKLMGGWRGYPVRDFDAGLLWNETYERDYGPLGPTININGTLEYAHNITLDTFDPEPWPEACQDKGQNVGKETSWGNALTMFPRKYPGYLTYPRTTHGYIDYGRKFPFVHDPPLPVGDYNMTVIFPSDNRIYVDNFFFKAEKAVRSKLNGTGHGWIQFRGKQWTWGAMDAYLQTQDSAGNVVAKSKVLLFMNKPADAECLEKITFFFREVSVPALQAWASSVSVMFQMVIYISISSYGDFGGQRKNILCFSAFIAQALCFSYGFCFQRGAYLIASWLFVWSNVFFGISIVMYNAQLPALAKDHQDVDKAIENKASPMEIVHVFKRAMEYVNIVEKENKENLSSSSSSS